MTSTETEVHTASAAWGDLHALIGKPFASSWIEVGEGARADFDPAAFRGRGTPRMSQSAYREGLVEGFHLLALLDHLVGQVSYVESERWFGWNYGLDRVRFTSPITTVDRIRVVGEVAELTREVRACL